MGRTGRNGRVLATSWLRAIALGLPLAGASLLGGCTCGGPCPPQRTDLTLSDVQLARIQEAREASGGGVFGAAECAQLCADIADENGVALFGPSSACELGPGDAGFTLTCTFQPGCGGRRPAGLVDPVVSTGIAGWLARSAHLEAASVPAFLELARELELHGAPPALARAARRSAVDEIRHARAIGALARRFGAAPPPVERARTAPRSLVELARDNAVEGCARETYAALVAVHQSRTARDPFVASTYAGIARDESRHALLSAAIDAWAADRLGVRRARSVDESRREALAELASGVEEGRGARAVLGLPDAERAHALATALA